MVLLQTKVPCHYLLSSNYMAVNVHCKAHGASLLSVKKISNGLFILSKIIISTVE